VDSLLFLSLLLPNLTVILFLKYDNFKIYQGKNWIQKSVIAGFLDRRHYWRKKRKTIDGQFKKLLEFLPICLQISEWIVITKSVCMGKMLTLQTFPRDFCHVFYRVLDEKKPMKKTKKLQFWVELPKVGFKKINFRSGLDFLMLYEQGWQKKTNIPQSGKAKLLPKIAFVNHQG